MKPSHYCVIGVLTLTFMGDLATPSYAAIEYAIAIHGGAGKAPTTDEWRHHREESGPGGYRCHWPPQESSP